MQVRVQVWSLTIHILRILNVLSFRSGKFGSRPYATVSTTFVVDNSDFQNLNFKIFSIGQSLVLIFVQVRVQLVSLNILILRNLNIYIFRPVKFGSHLCARVSTTFVFCNSDFENSKFYKVSAGQSLVLVFMQVRVQILSLIILNLRTLNF